MKRILVDMHRLRMNPYNGLYTFSCSLGKSLARLATPETELHYYLPRDKFGFFGEGLKYEGHHSLDKFYKFGTGKYDVWHTTTTISFYKPFSRRPKFLFTIHDLNFLIEHPELVKINKNRLKRIQGSVDRADFITAISDYSMKNAEKILNLGNKPRQVIHNGCTVNTFPDFDAPVFRPQRPFLFTVGMLQPRKNIHLLPALLQQNEYDLVISGMDHFEYREKVMEAVRQYKMEDRVHFTGPVSEQDKDWYYRHCEAFLFPSFAEGFGLPAIEAMYYGKPVFLSRETCLPEIGGDAAYYFNNFDADDMCHVFEKGMAHYRQHQPADKIRAQAARFSWDDAAASYLKIYREL